MSTTATTSGRATNADGQVTKPADQGQARADEQSSSERSPNIGQRRRPERVFRVGNCWATVWCNEHQQKSGPNQHTTRLIRSVNLERRFWNEKLKDGKGDWDSTTSFGLGDVHNALAVLQLAADHLKDAEGDVTRDA
jgi:hypothetical protein